MPARPGRPGAALLALVVILAITAAWWALALWPAGAVEPEWLARTRGACFGSEPGGLPDAGGWVLLIGEPIGMVGVLWIVWGRSLRADLARVRASVRWQLALAATLVLTLAGIALTGARVARAAALRATPAASVPGVPVRLDVAAPAVTLTDQRGRRTALADFRGRPTLLTFAFGHCATVCPTIVHELQAARRAVARADVPLLVITLDPWRDTPERLPTLAAHWELGADDRVLSGSVAEVERALDALGVGRRRDEVTGDVEHAGTVLLLDARGRIAWRVDGGAGRVREVLRVME